MVNEVNSFSLEAVFFDMDGTVLDSMGCWVRAVQMVVEQFEKEGVAPVLLLPTSPQEITSNIVAHLGNIEHYGLAPELVNRFEREVVMLVFQLMAEAPLFDGVIDVFEELNTAGIPIAIVSSSDDELLASHMHRLRIPEKTFQTIIGRSRTPKRNKPHPDPLLAAAKDLGVDVKKILMLGDNVVDIQAARHDITQSQVGLFLHATLEAYYGPHAERTFPSDPDFTFPEWNTFIALIEDKYGRLR